VNPSPLPLRPPSRRPAATRAPAALAALLLLAAALLLGGVPAASAGDTPAPVATASARARYAPETLDVARRIPVQDGGRVKPLDTYAQFTLLALNGRKSCKTAEGDTIPAIEWLLDVVFRPERGRRHLCFSVDTYEVLDAVGLAHAGKKKRDRYAYADLAPGRQALGRLASGLAQKDPKTLGPVEAAIVDLAHDLAAFERLSHLADFAREHVPLAPGTKLSALFAGQESVPATDVFARSPEILALARSGDPHAAPGGGDPAEAKALEELRLHLGGLVDAADVLSLVPPAVPASQQAPWFSLATILDARLRAGQVPADYDAVYQAFVAMAKAPSPTAFDAEVRRFREASAALAGRRGEYDKIGLEVALYRLDPFDRAVWLYLLAFLVIAVSWLKPAKALTWGAWGLLVAAVGLQTAGIVIRCVLRDRPPISTLYETVLFISACGAIASMVIEAISRRGIALALAPIVGGLTLFFANRYEVLKGEDTMPQLVAVLDTNFWLWLHVTCINIGYMGGLLASLVAHVHVLGRATGLQAGNDDFYRSVSRITYGMLAFALVFCVVGTILGGIWANESWGRFWGWDPKENGALLICLAQLAILHARLGGHLKPFGFAMATIAQGGVVVFSWWGVNLLGIGLHAYGFTAGILTALLAFYGVEALVLGVGLVTHLLGRTTGAPARPVAPPAA
jgi:ABC-type transport system involved in cytochrome c biogenesis permease subunit